MGVSLFQGLKAVVASAEELGVDSTELLDEEVVALSKLLSDTRNEFYLE